MLLVMNKLLDVIKPLIGKAKEAIVITKNEKYTIYVTHICNSMKKFSRIISTATLLHPHFS